MDEKSLFRIMILLTRLVMAAMAAGRRPAVSRFFRGTRVYKEELST